MANKQEELETAAQEEMARTWAEEADRRYEEIRRGEIAVEDSEEVFREARARLGKQQEIFSGGRSLRRGKVA